MGGDLHVNFKTKWFTAEGSKQQQELDKEIQEKYSDLLKQAESNSLQHWKDSPLSFVALIVLLDQFSRHIYRHQARSLIDNNDKRALALANELFASGWFQYLTVPQRVFCLMPFRHTPSLSSVEFVLEQIEKMTLAQQQKTDLLDRFRKVSARRLQGLQGVWEEGTDILERHPFKGDVDEIMKHKLYKTVHAFLLEHQAYSTGIVISLSGGVDSMCLCRILSQLREERKENWNIIAVHIDYSNRKESKLEAEFLAQWCKDWNLIFRLRTITDFKRGVTARDEYEVATRKIRYETYQQVLAEFKCPAVLFGHHKGDVQENVISNIMKGLSLLHLSGMGPSSVVNGVNIWRPMLVYEKDVIYEFAHKFGVPYFRDTTPKWSTRGKLRNHLVPLLQDMYGAGVLANLSKMAEQSEELNEMAFQTVFGPFFDSAVRGPLGLYVDIRNHCSQPIFFWKEALKQLCHSMHVGMIRDKPLREFVARLRKTFLASRERQPLEEMRPEVAKRQSKARERYERRKMAVRNGWVPLKPENRTMLFDGHLFLFEAATFPAESYFSPSQPVQLGTQSFGPWEVTLEMLPEEQGETDPVHFTTFELMKGSYEYVIPAAADYVMQAPLSKPFFKGVDEQFLKAVPTVGAASARQQTQHFCRVKVTFHPPARSAQHFDDEEDEEGESKAPATTAASTSTKTKTTVVAADDAAATVEPPEDVVAEVLAMDEAGEDDPNFTAAEQELAMASENSLIMAADPLD